MIIQTSKELKPRAKNDLYPTPIELCRKAVSLLSFLTSPKVLDPGAGYGPWGQAVREVYPGALIHGIEIDENINPTYISAYDEYRYCNFLDKQPDRKYNLIIGNPPYKYAQEFVEKSLDMLLGGGYLMFLLRLAFLESQKRYPFWKDKTPKNVWVLSRRPSFTGDHHTDETAYALFLWEKRWQGKSELDWLWWDYED